MRAQARVLDRPPAPSAKDLLAGLRDETPAATLAHAAEWCWYALRNVTHLLTWLPTPADFGRLLAAVDRRVSSGPSGRQMPE